MNLRPLSLLQQAHWLSAVNQFNSNTCRNYNYIEGSMEFIQHRIKLLIIQFKYVAVPLKFKYYVFFSESLKTICGWWNLSLLFVIICSFRWKCGANHCYGWYRRSGEGRSVYGHWRLHQDTRGCQDSWAHHECHWRTYRWTRTCWQWPVSCTV